MYLRSSSKYLGIHCHDNSTVDADTIFQIGEEYGLLCCCFRHCTDRSYSPSVEFPPSNGNWIRKTNSIEAKHSSVPHPGKQFSTCIVRYAHFMVKLVNIKLQFLVFGTFWNE